MKYAALALIALFISGSGRATIVNFCHNESHRVDKTVKSTAGQTDLITRICYDKAGNRASLKIRFDDQGDCAQLLARADLAANGSTSGL